MPLRPVFQLISGQKLMIRSDEILARHAAAKLRSMNELPRITSICSERDPAALLFAILRRLSYRSVTNFPDVESVDS